MKTIYIIGTLLVLGVAALLIVFTSPQASVPLAGEPYESHPYVEIVQPSGFVNTDHITLEELIGKKVILVEFLTYSCINCQRTFPYTTSWYSKYRDEGLEIVGIHTPEFAFEQDINNVREAMKKFGIEYPIVLDNNYETWRAYGNKYWPRKYLIDINGNIVYDHIGEGGYDETEHKIRELLKERAKALGEEVGEDARGSESAVIETSVPEAGSPETYFGYGRNEFLANGTPGQAGTDTFILPTTVEKNKLYLGGTWTIEPQSARAGTDASVIYRYSSKEVYVVASSDTPMDIEVWQDGALVGASAGADVQSGVVRVHNAQLYKLISNPVAGEHTLELRVQGGGVRLYTFTFG